MKTVNRAVLGGLALCALGAAPAFAADYSYPYYVGYSHKQGAPLTAEQRLQLHLYAEYEEREPCQNYREPPVGFYVADCTLMYNVPAPAPRVVQQTVTETVTERTELQTIQEYNVYFNFDKSDIRASEIATLDRLADEISVYQPTEVTVAGHTDTSGNVDYNYALSQRRADAVSQALTARGVVHRVIREEAYGESQPAVSTGDGVKLEENRRVEIEFLK